MNEAGRSNSGRSAAGCCADVPKTRQRAPRGRRSNFRDIPTVAELLPDFAAVGWFVLAAPARTDPANISKLSRDLKTILTQPEFQRRLLELATYTQLMTPRETSEFIRDEQQRWKPVLQQVMARTR